MSTVKWGKPTLEICKLTNGEIPENATWDVLDNPVEDSTQLTTTKGNVLEARGEGGELIDSYTRPSAYSVVFELYAKRNAQKPIEDEDGVVKDEYAFRLTPEDSTLPGFILKKCSVNVEDTFAANIGEKWKYTFTALKPKTGKMKEVYTAGA